MIYLIGMVLTFLWMNVLLFDVWLSFHRFEEAKDSLTRLALYLAFVAVGTAAIILVFLLDDRDVEIILLSIGSLLALWSFTLMGITCFKICRLSRNEKVNESNRFQGENDR